ncbi:MAG: sulfate adenylyltransferase subunit CysN [Leptospiraceae bacterium]|nr:sulfate adenylyltransferase subunit CysN [Leptospiraceae bacterium]
MDMLRFLTAGSVDDGKSTLIGRLLYDSKSIFEDQLEAIEASSQRRGDTYTNLALLTDGLKAEREQGITIDVAYKYFATPKRKFIIADTPGHIQYTRNMVTGASTANLAIILVDARKGVVEQTMRHSFITALLGIPHLVLCVNKMDLVDFSKEIYENIHADFLKFVKKLNIKDVSVFPISALNGDNVVEKSKNLDWYTGSTLLSFLEEVHIEDDKNLEQPRFPVQWVIRPMSNEYHDYRGYAGSVASGIFKKGQDITIYPSGLKSKIKSIDTLEGELEEAFPPQSVTIRLEDELDISRGDIICGNENTPKLEQEITSYVCWMDTKPLNVGDKYMIQHNTSFIKCIVKEIHYKLNTNTLEKIENHETLELNDIARVTIKFAKPIVYDDYRKNRIMGSFIIINEGTNNTSGAGMIIEKEIV